MPIASQAQQYQSTPLVNQRAVDFSPAQYYGARQQYGSQQNPEQDERSDPCGQIMACIGGVFMCCSRGIASCLKGVAWCCMGGTYIAGKAAYDGGDAVINVALDGGDAVLDAAYYGWEIVIAHYVVGFFIMLMIVLIPIWDGISLLKDPVWMYMTGDVLPIVLIFCSVCIPIFALLTVFLLNKFARIRSGVQAEQTMYGASLLFVLLLGATLVSISEPMTKQAMLSQQEFVHTCEGGLRTQPLYKEYQTLQKLRTSANCTGRASVAECSGYKETTESVWLQKFETSLQCSGYCFYPKNVSEAEVKRMTQPLKASSMKSKSFYPQALFTNVNLQGSCSAMAARSMESYVSDMSNQLLYEGFFLIGAAVLQGFIMMWVSTSKRALLGKSSYGTTGRQWCNPASANFSPYVGDIRRRAPPPGSYS